MKFLSWIFLSVLLGNPLLALVVLVVIYWMTDRYTLGLLPDPFRLVSRWQRLSHLNRRLNDNPHDRKARLDKADVLLELRRPKAAFAAVRPNVEAGDHDPHTLYVAGRAAFGAGEFDNGRRLLEAVREDDPSFAQGGIDLELGRGLLQAGRPEEAKVALERFVGGRTSAIEGNVLLGRARAAMGEAEGAAAARHEAWRAFVSAPRFLQRRQRWWAYQANPTRPVIYLAVGAVVAGTLAVAVAPNF